MPRDNRGDEPYAMGESKAVRETDKAVLCVLADETQRWIPKSVVHDDSEVWKKGDDGKLVVKRWWAEKNVADDAG